MRIGAWNNSKEFMSEFPGSYTLQEAGILEAHRFLYLFFNDEDIQRHKNNIPNIPGTPIFGKAIQINLSVTQGGSENYDVPAFFRGTNNSTYMTICMYIYDTVFDTHITNIQSAEFQLVNSMISSTTNEYDYKKTMSMGVNFYEKDIRDKPDVKDIIASKVYVQAPSIPEPMYYTQKHQMLNIDEIYCLTSLDTSVIHKGHELLDENTRVSVMQIKMLDTLEPRLRSKLAEVKILANNPNSGVNMYDQTLLSENLLYQDFESMQSGYTYIYDSNMGFNILKNSGGYLPFRKYQFEEKMLGDLERTMTTIKEHAKNVEKQFGAVRMVFTPLYYGDKTDVYFKDFNKDNQPTIKENINIDNGNKIKNEMSNLIDEAQQEYETFELANDEIGGYIDGLQD